MRNSSLAAVLLGSLFAIGPIPVCAQTSSAAPPDVQLTLRTRSGQTTFHIGEVIALEMLFASSTPEKYQLDNASYDRSGRLNEDKYIVEPATGWDDPLALYFRAYSGFMVGGLRGLDILGMQPKTIHSELNEWVRFNAPGTYHLRVISGRVSVKNRTAFAKAFQLPSNSITLTIVPATKEWEDATLKFATALLDASKPADAPMPPSDPRMPAAKTLRYLGTADAAREMARRLTGTAFDWDFEAGLIGSPARETALAEMQKLLVDPNFPVTDRFLSTMAILSLPEDAKDAKNEAENGNGQSTTPDERDRLEKEFRQELMSAVAQKQGAALAVSTNTIIEDAAIYSHSLPGEVKRALTQQLVATFEKLPEQKQAELLEYRWAALDHEAMLPLLRRVAQRYQYFPVLNEMHAFEFNNASGAALMHWYEIAPDEARPAIMREILRPTPRFGAKILGILPDKELPEADQPLIDHLTATDNYGVRSNTATLIERYATPAIMPQVVNFLDPLNGKLDCITQPALLAYLLKVDPATAKPRIEAALAARGPGFSGCNSGVLGDIAKLHNDPILQELALRALDDDSPQVVGGAAAYLKDYGSSSAEDSLWLHFVRWSEQWKGRESEFEYVPGQSLDGQYESGAGMNLLQALVTAHGWVTDDNKLHRLINLSVGPQQRQQVEAYLAQWRGGPWTIIYNSFPEPRTTSFQIAQYEEHSLQNAQDKLLQFPRGSKFQWFGSGSEGAAKAYEEISQFAAEHGMQVLAEK